MTIDEIYLNIAKNISSVIKADWQRAVLHLEVLTGMVSNTGVYYAGKASKGNWMSRSLISN